MDKQISINAEKIGAVAEKVSIGQQNITTTTEVNVETVTIINYNYAHATPHQLTEPSSSLTKTTKPYKTNPYKGLAHFGPADADLFFGRDDLIKKLLNTVTENPFTAIIGPSGSGKSSIVLAGVAPQLSEQGGWLFSYFRVSDSALKDPFLAMMQALIPFYAKNLDDVDRQVQAKKTAQYLQSGKLTLVDINDRIRKNFPHKKLLLIADQFEELFTTGATEETQKKFISLMVEAGNLTPAQNEQPSLSIVLTMRADFLERATSFATFATLIDQYSHIIGPMEQDQLHLAIEEPASLRGVTFEAGLIDTILEDAGFNQGNLPLVEFTLSLLWDRQQNNQIGLQAYHELGRIKGALTQHAQTIYEKLPSSQHSSAQRIFTQLVKVGLGTEDTRRIAYRSDFLPQDWQLLQRFANESHRLIVTNKKEEVETAEVVHEALIQHWLLLKKWVQQDRLFLSWLDALRRATEQWQQHDQDTGSLLRGAALQQALEWQQSKSDRISKQQHDFILQSQFIDLQNARKKKRLAQVSGLLAIAIIIALSFMGFSLNKSLELASKQRDKQLVTQSRFLADLSHQHSQRGNARLATLLALEALPNYRETENQRRPYVVEAYAGLYDNLGRYMDRLWLNGHTQALVYVAYSPDGQHIVTASWDGTARLWDAETGKELAILNGHEGEVTHAAFSPDGQRIVTTSRDYTARLWDAETGKELAILNGHEGEVTHAAYSPNGQYIITASIAGMRLWDAETGKELAASGKASTHLEYSPNSRHIVVVSYQHINALVLDMDSDNQPFSLSGHSSAIFYAAFSPDSKRIVTASDDNTARLWDVETGKELSTLSGHTDSVGHAAFSPNGQRIVTASDDNTARLWDAETGKELSTLRGHLSRVTHVTYSPSGQRIVTSSDDHTARLWDAETGKLLATLSGHSKNVVHSAFSPDGQRIVTASWDSTARLWDAKTGKELTLSILRRFGDVNHVADSPDSQHIVTASQDNTARLYWDSGKALTTFGRDTKKVVHAAYSFDGQSIVTVSQDNTARLWDAETGKALTALSGHTKNVVHAAYSPDGQRIVTASQDNTARLWDAETGKLLATLSGHTKNVVHSAFSPDGQHIVTASWDGTARLWDAETGKELATLSGHSREVFHAAYSPDGQQIVTASMDYTARLWDAGTGKELVTLSGHTNHVTHAAYSPNGQQIVTASLDDTARLWDAGTGKELVTLSGHTNHVTHAAYSPNGQQIVTTSWDKTARLWDAKTGKGLATLSGHLFWVRHAAYSYDGQQIVTASQDNTARLWDTETGKLLATLSGHSGPVIHVDFSPDGQRIVTASTDNTVRIWSNPSYAELVEHFEALNLPPLTEQERREAFLD